MEKCRRCLQHPISRPRGLCWHCYYKPGVRERFPSTSCFAPHAGGPKSRFFSTCLSCRKDSPEFYCESCQRKHPILAVRNARMKEESRRVEAME